MRFQKILGPIVQSSKESAKVDIYKHFTTYKEKTQCHQVDSNEMKWRCDSSARS
jgi:hypothetical protein